MRRLVGHRGEEGLGRRRKGRQRPQRTRRAQAAPRLRILDPDPFSLVFYKLIFLLLGQDFLRRIEGLVIQNFVNQVLFFKTIEFVYF